MGVGGGVRIDEGGVLKAGDGREGNWVGEGDGELQED